MQADIADKNSKIAQLDTRNTRLFTHNNHLTELCSKGKLFKKEEKEAESEEEEEIEEKRGKREIEEYSEQERKPKSKSMWHERTKCNREECKFHHPRKVCTKYNQDNCELGDYCKDNHPKKSCTF